ncbi:hypothetical protein EMCRGX_G001010 [Ephydatia muelleri]
MYAMGRNDGSGHCNGVETGPYHREWTLQWGRNGAISSGVDIATGSKRGHCNGVETGVDIATGSKREWTFIPSSTPLLESMFSTGAALLTLCPTYMYSHTFHCAPLPNHPGSATDLSVRCELLSGSAMNRIPMRYELQTPAFFQDLFCSYHGQTPAFYPGSCDFGGIPLIV